MARPQKTGLNYYNIDTDRYSDIRIKKLKFACKAAGIAIYDYLICEIYRDKGFYIEWNQDTIFDVRESLSLQEGLAEEVVRYCAEIGLFNSRIYNEQKILTSHSIQQRYIEICKNAKRKDWLIPELIKLTKEETGFTKEETRVNTGESTQSKVKESKEEESKVTQKENLIEIFFKDLENFSGIETIAINNRVDVDWVKSQIPLFRSKAELTYPNFERFTSHFKNFIHKQIEKKINGQQGNKNSGKTSTDRVVELAKQMLAGNNGHNG